MEDKIKLWYQEKFTTDELGAYLSDCTFEDLHKDLTVGKDVYDTMGVGDSLVRERVFEELANRMSVSYEVIYRMWLDS